MACLFIYQCIAVLPFMLQLFVIKSTCYLDESLVCVSLLSNKSTDRVQYNKMQKKKKNWKNLLEKDDIYFSLFLQGILHRLCSDPLHLCVK